LTANHVTECKNGRVQALSFAVVNSSLLHCNICWCGLPFFLTPMATMLANVNIGGLSKSAF